MRVLLDTHAWIWLIAEPQRLNESARRDLTDPAVALYLSVAAIWEIAMKHTAGRLRYTGDPSVMIPQHVRRSDATVLPIEMSHVLSAAALPMHHRDPFDRVMVAQALELGLTVATADPLIGRYGVQTLEVA